jgi:Flp pilus assembly protein TadD
VGRCCRHAVFFVFLHCLLAACSSHDFATYRLSIPDDQSALLNGDAFGLDPGHRAEQVALNSVNEEMRQFLALHVSPELSNIQKVQRILEAILADGLQLSYDNFKTLTAEEAFYARQGNCMSFTNLFVALAREAGVDVYYQEVEVPPSWAENGDTWFDNRHINVVVNLPGSKRKHVVDFSLASYDVDLKSRKLEDAAVLARYHNNMGVHWMSEMDYQRAFLSFREAIALRPEVGHFWTNLGTLYRRDGHNKKAELAYLTAIALDSEPAAMSNLSRLYAEEGDADLAAYYEERVLKYRRKNPYYLYELAEEAYAGGSYRQAERWLLKAIRLQKDEHEFHSLMALTQVQMSNYDDANEYFLKARELATENDDRARYSRKIELLAVHSKA